MQIPYTSALLGQNVFVSESFWVRELCVCWIADRIFQLFKSMQIPYTRALLGQNVFVSERF